MSLSDIPGESLGSLELLQTDGPIPDCRNRACQAVRQHFLESIHVLIQAGEIRWPSRS